MTILLVEDSKFLRAATERALTGAGYEVISVGDGDQALILARTQAPGLILLGFAFAAYGCGFQRRANLPLLVPYSFAFREHIGTW